ncbi:MAG: S1C family serine protease [Polyangiales bacterium]
MREQRAMRGVLSKTSLVLLSLSLAGFGACRKPNDDDKGDKDKPLPASAQPVASPTMGLSTGPVVIPTPAVPGVPAGAPVSFAPLSRAAEPAVVTIIIMVKSKHGRLIRKGLGSGFLIDKQGTILSNNHVVSGGNAIAVELSNGKRVEAKVLGTDPATDVGVVHIEPPEGIEPISLGDSDQLAVGDWVFAIGNPLGLTHTVTAGILSAKGRTTKDVPLKAPGGADAYFDFLQTDAAINPGNSGGPLLNLKGEAIGINTAINAAGQGLAFAIPINMVKQMLPSLVKEGHLVRSYLGVGIEDAQFDDKTGTKGAIVFKVYKDTPASKAGLKEQDQILAVDGVSVRDSAQMRWLVSVAGVGKKVTLRVVRDNKAFDLPVKLEKLPEKPSKPSTPDDDEDDDE